MRKKHETSELHGILSKHIELPADATSAGRWTPRSRFNEDPTVDGYLIQNPTPGCDFNAALEAIDPDKDCDGLHPMSLGRLAHGIPGPVPCTPAGIVAMLQHYQIPVEGRHVVVVGRGPTLGRPLSLLLGLKRPGANAAVTNVHTGVPNIADYTRQADILIGAAGVPGIIQPDMVKPGAVGDQRWHHVARKDPAARRRRGVRRRCRLDHPSPRRRGRDDGGDAAAQHGRVLAERTL